MRRLILLCLFPALLNVSPARDFENGDFARDKLNWLGDGRIVFLKPDGTASPTEVPDSTRAIEIDLSKTQFKEITQKFETPEGAGALNVEVVYKGAADFKLNEKATKFTRDNTWQAGGTWYWSGLVFPKVDLCIRLDQPGGYSYRLASVTPGSDWQTLKFRWDNVGAKKDVKLCVAVPPGEGKFYLKSVSVTP